MAKTGPSVSNSATDYSTADLVAFGLVVDRGSITAAAAELGETKGSVSRRISRLESRVGAPLLVRTGRAVGPTDAGVAFRVGVASALESLENARAVVHGFDAEPRGILRVTAPQGLGSLILAPKIGEFLDRCPHLRVDLRLTDAVLSFTEHRIDVALRLSASLPDSALVARKLFPIEGELVASPAYLAKHGIPADIDDLAHHRLIIPPISGQTMRVRMVPRAGGPAREIVIRGTILCHDMVFALHAAVADAGIAVLTQHMATIEVDAGRLVRILPDWRHEAGVSLWLVHLAGPVPSKVRAFRDFMAEFVGQCSRS